MVGIVDLEWIVEDGTVLVIFRRPSIVTDIENVSPNVSPNVSQNFPIKSSLNERQRKIKAMICDDETITVAKIAKIINVKHKCFGSYNNFRTFAFIIIVLYTFVA